MGKCAINSNPAQKPAAQSQTKGLFGYVPNVADSTVSAYTINQTTGALTQVSGSPFTAGSEAYGVSVEPSDKFVYVVASGRNAVFGYTINAKTGALTPVSGSPFTRGAFPEEIATCRVARTVCKPSPL
jgi:6-phosphogluconolactonase